MSEDKIPTAWVEEIRDNPWPDHPHARIVVVRCPYCGGTHTHGLPDGEIGLQEHRVADCGAGAGYFLGRKYDLGRARCTLC